MNDRELLEIAAKVAGKMLKADGIYQFDDWNPLTNDGDALRLAVKLGIGFWVGSFIVYCSWYTEGENPFTEGMAQLAEKIVNDDPYAATRRAIVRAAAEIGRNT
jgi:hypothetical protein